LFKKHRKHDDHGSSTNAYYNRKKQYSVVVALNEYWGLPTSGRLGSELNI
jgi:hypothetical protein